MIGLYEEDGYMVHGSRFYCFCCNCFVRVWDTAWFLYFLVLVDNGYSIL